MAKTSKKPAKPVKAKPPKKRAALRDRLITVKAKENPRRKGTAAHKYHEAMAKSKTVGQYLSRYSDPKARRDASLWLSTSARQGHVKLQAA